MASIHPASLVFLFFFFGLSLQEEVHGCGGFVRPSDKVKESMQEPLDLSKVKVSLFSQSGALKTSVNCAPNGYYFLPIEEKGNFELKISGLQGWSFDPEFFSITSTSEGVLECLEDVSFEVTGFGVSGSVVAGDAGSDISSVKIELWNPKKDKIVQTTTCDSNGHFLFSRVAQQEYVVKVSHASWTISPDQAVIKVKATENNDAGIFQITGFTISGSVLSSNQPTSGVSVFLNSSLAVNGNLGCKKVTGDIPKKKEAPICVVTSDENGVYRFTNIPNGDYELVPLYQGTTSYDVSPTHISVSVKNGDFDVSQPFKVVGFSISGRVVDVNGAGVSDVAISIDGIEKVVTDTHGNYLLEKLKLGKHTISASKVNAQFSVLKNIQLNPSLTRISDIVLERNNVCGRVIVDNAKGLTNVILTKRKIELLDASQNVIGHTTTETNGRFCIMVPPGKFSLRALVSSAESAAGLILAPQPYRITVPVSQPLFNIEFVQTRSAISGRVICQDFCPSDLEVSVTPADEVDATATLTLGEDDRSGNFRFDELLPGDYDVSIHYTGWCWKKETQRVVLSTKDVEGLSFEQTGFSVSVSSSHSISAKLTHETLRYGDSFSLKMGMNNLCLPYSGKYKLKPDSCAQFDQEEYIVDTARQQVRIRAVKFQVIGTLVVNKELKNSKSELSVDILTDAKPQRIASVAIATPNPSKPGEFEFSFWATPRERIEIAPKPSSELGVLFYPASRYLSLAEQNQPTIQCPAARVVFEGREGLYASGSVNPPVEKIEISVFVASDASRPALITTYTKPDGSFHAGPLYDDQEYIIRPFKSGYRITTKDGSSFQTLSSQTKHVDLFAERLSSIFVNIVDETDKPITNVLLSLSGSSSYRNNTRTGLEDEFQFSLLESGEYFLRPMLKEYEFVPSGLSISLKGGQDFRAEFKAKRVAFSCFGKIRLLNGDAAVGILVQAIDESGAHEEAITDETGSFRVRGLLPSREYTITVRTGRQGVSVLSSETALHKSGIDQCIPESTKITIPQGKDILDLSFVVLPLSATVEIAGTVEIEDWLVEKARVEVLRQDSPNQVLYSKPLMLSKYFEFSGLSNTPYIVRTAASLPESQYKIISSSQSIEWTDFSRRITASLSLSVEPQIIHDDVHVSSIVIFILVAVFFVLRNQFGRISSALFQRK